MLVPRLTGYPIDRSVVQRRQRERHERRARKQAEMRRGGPGAAEGPGDVTSQ